MHLSLPDFQPDRTPEPPAQVQVVAHSDVTWNRRVFKAPPLVINPTIDPHSLVDELRLSIRSR